jgi:hypothetical protein
MPSLIFYPTCHWALRVGADRRAGNNAISRIRLVVETGGQDAAAVLD